jgi:1-acyl-sn-glycerol-3-phosphate acyltransferase
MFKRIFSAPFYIFTSPLLLVWYATGWRAEGQMPAVDKMVVVGAPHTSNWDYVHMIMLAIYFRRKPFVTIKDYWMKKPIFGTLLRWGGGLSIDRSKSTNTVQQLVEQIKQVDRIMLIFTPEGTRRKTHYWRTGFYYTALGAGVPVVLAYLDYKRKRGGVGTTLTPSGNIEADFEIIREFYRTYGWGKHAEQAGEVRLLPKENDRVEIPE